MTHLKLRTLREVDLEMVAVTALNVAFRDSSREWRDAVVELRFRDVILSQNTHSNWSATTHKLRKGTHTPCNIIQQRSRDGKSVNSQLCVAGVMERGEGER